jgi:hypothetical protein
MRNEMNETQNLSEYAKEQYGYPNLSDLVEQAKEQYGYDSASAYAYVAGAMFVIMSDEEKQILVRALGK